MSFSNSIEYLYLNLIQNITNVEIIFSFVDLHWEMLAWKFIGSGVNEIIYKRLYWYSVELCGLRKAKINLRQLAITLFSSLT